MSDIFTGLTASQQAAVFLPANSHAMLFAGAGSGKTRVLTARIANLIKSGVPPENILAVTFTRKAAGEMRKRFQECLPDPSLAPRVTCGTFHSFAAQQLRRFHMEAGLPAAFSIIDEDDSESLQKFVLDRLDTLKWYQSKGSRKYLKKLFAQVVSLGADQGMRAANCSIPRSNPNAPNDPTANRLRVAWEMYEFELEQGGQLDFGQLQLRLLQLLTCNERIRTILRNQFTHVLVDEFQDTNNIQYEIVRLLARLPGQDDGAWVMCVGDDDQSIYAFRGARIENIQRFKRDFNTPILRLEENWRSSANIVNAANKFIEGAPGEREKVMRPTKDNGASVEANTFSWEGEEFKGIARGCQFHHLQGTPWNEIAVLCRTNANLLRIESTLLEHGIPVQIVGQLGFFRRAPVKNAVAWAQCIHAYANGRTPPWASFTRAVSWPKNGIGGVTIEKMRQRWDHAVYERTNPVQAALTVPGKAVQAFRSKLELIADKAGKDPSLSTLFYLSICNTGLLDFYNKSKADDEEFDEKQEIDDSEENTASSSYSSALPLDNEELSTGNARILKVLYDIAIHHEQEGEKFAKFMDYVSLYAEKSTKARDAVQLMTIHKAKGLEFDVVFLPCLLNGIFPRDDNVQIDERSLTNTMLGCQTDAPGEEDRVMYVAITRARKHLYLSHSKHYQTHNEWKKDGQWSTFVINGRLPSSVAFASDSSGIPNFLKELFYSQRKENKSPWERRSPWARRRAYEW